MFGNRFRLVSVVAAGAVAAATLVGPPAQAATSTVTGSVSSANGVVDMASVSFYEDCQDVGGTPAGSASVAGGNYTVSIPDGTYVVHIRPSSPGSGIVESWHSAAATCGQSSKVDISGDRNLDLVAIPGSQVGATVRGDDGQSLGSVDSVEFYATCQDYQGGRPAPASVWPSFGQIFLARVPNGTYRVLIHWDGSNEGSWHGSAATCEQAEAVLVDGDTNVDLVIRTDSLVTGTVSSSNGPSAAGTVEFYASCDDYEWDDPVGSASWSGGGSYKVAVPDGTYRVWIGPDDGTGAVESWRSGAADCEGATPVTIGGDRALDLVALPGSDVTGTVSDLGGPLTVALVVFWASCQDYEQDDDAWFAFMTGGAYLLTVPDGTYRVQILTLDSDSGDIVESWHSAAATCDAATVVTINGDRTLNLLARGGTAPQPSPSASSPPPTTPSTPPPTAATPLRTQKVVRPPKRLKRGKSAKLARRTKQGSPLTWRTTTKKICRLKAYQVTGLKKGKCRVRPGGGARRPVRREASAPREGPHEGAQISCGSPCPPTGLRCRRTPTVSRSRPR